MYISCIDAVSCIGIVDEKLWHPSIASGWLRWKMCLTLRMVVKERPGKHKNKYISYLKADIIT